MVRPSEQKTRRIGATAHSVISRAIRSANHNRDRRYGGVGNSVDQLGAIADDAVFFIAAAHHKTCNVLQKQQRNVLLVAKLDELRAFTCRLRHQHAVVSQNSHGKAVNASKAGHKRWTILRFELGKLTARSEEHTSE